MGHNSEGAMSLKGSSTLYTIQIYGNKKTGGILRRLSFDFSQHEKKV
jgi:hypothetical protein